MSSVFGCVAVRGGTSHVDDISDTQVADAFAAVVPFTNDESWLDETDAVVICVPTPLDGKRAPDLFGVFAGSARHVLAHARAALRSS